MRQFEISLDQCRDLLRQRRVRRATQLNPEEGREASRGEHSTQEPDLPESWPEPALYATTTGKCIPAI